MSARRPVAGFFLSLLTALMWGVLPVAFVVLIGAMDTITITWYRFTLAAIVVFVFLWRRGKLPALRTYNSKVKLVLFLAAAALAANFVFYLSSLSYLNPESAQVLIQMAPFILMFGSIFFYKERLGWLEWIGVALLLGGFSLFFNDRLAQIFSSLNDYSIGILLMVLASVTWGTYGLLQKTLLTKYGFNPAHQSYVSGRCDSVIAFCQSGNRVITEWSAVWRLAVLQSEPGSCLRRVYRGAVSLGCSQG